MSPATARPARSTPKRPARSKPRTAPKAPAPAISDAAVRKATGRAWDEWFAILDAFDVKKHGHKAAAAHLHAKKAGDWWAQMIVVTYERARGLRVKHQTARGYSVSASRVINAPLAEAFDAVTNRKRRAAWLPRLNLKPGKATPRKYARFAVISGDEETSSSLEINFYDKGAARCQVTIQHSKLRTAQDVKRMKTTWSEAVDRLRSTLES